MSLIFRNFWKIFSLWTFDSEDTPCFAGTLLRITETSTTSGGASAAHDTNSSSPYKGTGATSEDHVLCRSRAHKPERRRYTRHGCAADAQFRTTGSSVIRSGELTDLSLGGCYIKAAENCPLGATLEIALRAKNVRLYLHGRVTAIHAEGIRVEFAPGLTGTASRLPKFAKLLRRELAPQVPLQLV
jgi:hypothetical protein